jgi:hypothetical protein
MSWVRRFFTPSPSKGLERRPRFMCGSSTMEMPFAKTLCPIDFLRKLVPRAMAAPEIALAKWSTRPPETRGS